MAHFAEIDSNNKVIRVIVIPDEEEHRGQDFCSIDLGLGGTWLQTSYNSYGGVHYTANREAPSGKTAFRKNYAGINFTYDEERDAFIEPQPYFSWLLNEDTCIWEPPVSYPSDGNLYMWDEDSISWVEQN